MSLTRIPHPIPYQGSKRRLAPMINNFVNGSIDTLYEPFAGSAAFSLYASANQMARRFVIGDKLEPLVNLWALIVNKPEVASARYREIWEAQQEGDPSYFYKVREQFNDSRDPVLLLYLVARCVKNAVRFGQDGRFTQSADKRRLGTHPDTMAKSIEGASNLLRGKTDFFVGDFADCIAGASPKDLVYMDPPYQGTTYGQDKRYVAQVELPSLCSILRDLQERSVSFILSYDGMTGEKKHGQDMPSDLNLERVFLDGGRSTQATLNGQNARTVESLYLWGDKTKVDPMYHFASQLVLPF